MKKANFLAGSILMLAVIFFCYSCSAQKASAGTAHKHKTGKKGFYFLFLSDVHLATNITQSAYGQDAGTDLWGACKGKIDSILKSANPPAFILYTGDVPEHGGIYDTSLRNTNISNLLTDLHGLAAVKHIPLFYLPGNNDGLGGDYCLFSTQNGRTAFSLVPGYTPYPYQSFNVPQTRTGKGAYMISDANLAAGYYAAHVMPGLRIISLNSVIWSSQICGKCPVPENCTAQPGDGDLQMAWLQQQLADAAKAGDKVYLAMHIPPGADAYASSNSPGSPVYMWKNTGWQDQFLAAVARYRKTVAGMFYGHTHMDEFRLLYDSTNMHFTQVAMSCPGISPMFGNNPGFKLVTVNGATKLPTDFMTCYATVGPVVWQQPYRFSQQAGVKKGLSIYDALRQMTPAQRNAVLNATYTVKHGTATYDTLGMYVKWIK